MVPDAGISKATGISRIMSGLPIDQPSTNLTGAGASLALPAGAPASTQDTRVLTSPADMVRSLENLPCCGSAYHGGIFFVATAVLMALAQGRVVSYDKNDIGPASPGRWQFWQFF